MKYYAEVKVDPATAVQIDFFLNGDVTRETCQNEDETITHTAHFDNGYEMDIKCCGVYYEDYYDEYYNNDEDLDEDDFLPVCNNSYVDAVLFNEKGYEVALADPSEDEYLGEYELEYNGDTYIANVVSY